MALTDNGQWTIIYTFEDRDRNTATVSANIDGGLIYTAAATEGAAIGAALSALSDARLVRQTIIRGSVEDDILTRAPESSDVERKGYFAFRDADNRVTSVSVPSIKNDVVIDGTNIINPNDVTVSAFVTALVANGRTFRNLDIIRLDYAEKRHRGSKNG